MSCVVCQRSCDDRASGIVTFLNGRNGGEEGEFRRVEVADVSLSTFFFFFLTLRPDGEK